MWRDDIFVIKIIIFYFYDAHSKTIQYNRLRMWHGGFTVIIDNLKDDGFLKKPPWFLTLACSHFDTPLVTRVAASPPFVFYIKFFSFLPSLYCISSSQLLQFSFYFSLRLSIRIRVRVLFYLDFCYRSWLFLFPSFLICSWLDSTYRWRAQRKTVCLGFRSYPLQIFKVGLLFVVLFILIFNRRFDFPVHWRRSKNEASPPSPAASRQHQSEC